MLPGAWSPSVLSSNCLLLALQLWYNILKGIKWHSSQLPTPMALDCPQQRESGHSRGLQPESRSSPAAGGQ